MITKHFDFVIISFVFLTFGSSVFAQDFDIKLDEYDCSIPKEARVHRPSNNAIKIPIKIGLFIIDVKEIDDIEQTFTVDIWLSLTWNDSRLSEKTLGKSLVNCVYKTDEIWMPQLLAVNRNQGKSLFENIARVDAEGTVNIKQRYVGDISVDLDFADFPFDIQELNLALAVVGKDRPFVELKVDENLTGQRDLFSAEGWSIEFIDAVYTHDTLKTWAKNQSVNLDMLVFRLLAERDRDYYLWKVIAPLCLIVLMAWAVFWIDPKHLGPQVGLSTATVFTLIAYRFSIGISLPKISYFTRLDEFVFYSTILVFIALGAAIVTSKISSDGENTLAIKIEKIMRILYISIFLAILVFTLWL